MTLIRRTRSLLALTLLMACSSDGTLVPTGGLRFAFAQRTCGPADGPAIAIYLTREPTSGPPPVAPYTRISIDLSSSDLDGRLHAVGPNSPDAFATFSRTDNDYEPASAGYVTADYSDNGDSITGAADIVFPDAGHVVSQFKAHVFPMNFLCP